MTTPAAPARRHDTTTRPPHGLRVLVVAEDPRVHTSIRHLLASDPALHVVDARTNHGLGTEADVVVCDVSGPQGRSAVRELTGSAEAPVVALGFDETDGAMALAAGAQTYLAKTAPPDDLLAAVHRVTAPPARSQRRLRASALVLSRRRPVWAAVGLVLAADVLAVALALLGDRLPPGGGDTADLVRRLVVVMVVAAGAVLVVARTKAWRAAGAAGPGTWRSTGLLIVPTLVALAPLVTGLRLPAAPTLAVLVVGYAATGVFEELWHRGVVLHVLRPVGLRRAAVIGGALFGASHLTNVAFGQPLSVSVAQSVGAFCFGVGFSVLRWRTNAVWLLAAIHAVGDLLLKVTNLHGGVLWGVLVGHDIAMLAWGLWCLRGLERTRTSAT